MMNKKYKGPIQKRGLALCLVVVLLIGSITPLIIKAYNLNDGWYSLPSVTATWGDDSSAIQWLAAHPRYAERFIPTGLAFNNIPYPINPNLLTPEELALLKDYWPLGGQMFLTARPGYENSEYSMFDGRHTFCTANHEIADAISPGAQVFADKREYNIPDNIFPPASTGKTNPNFNFLMLAIACYYPGDYKLPDDATYIDSDPSLVPSIVGQAIAWLSTDADSTGFTGNSFSEDFTFYKNSRYYRLMTDSFPRSLAPTIYDELHAKPLGTTGAAEIGITKMMDAYFYDVWNAAFLTSKLTPDWDKGMSTSIATLQQENGEYHAYIDMFTSPEAQIYLQGIAFKPYGDWVSLGLTEDGKMHFKSISGDVDENGAIGELYWPDDTIGSFMPVDVTKAKILAFDTYNANANPPSFGRTQTQFSAYIEKGLNVYVVLGTDNEPGAVGGSVERFKHKENFDAAYNVNLIKYDSETGKPLAGSHWDILEAFDDTQLDKTDLDREPGYPGEYQSGLGSLNSTSWGDDDISSNYGGNTGVTVSDTNKYNWGNDGGTQFERWDDPEEDPCKRDDNVTSEDGMLHEVDSSGNESDTVAHTDIKSYIYNKGYCGGHPAPEIEYIDCDHDEEDDCDCEEQNQKLHDDAWEAWYEEVKKCESMVEEGGFFHAIDSGAARKAMEDDRDQFFKDFISLKYEYSAKETEAAKGYILHGTHTDDIPVEWRTVTSSEYKDTGEATHLSHTGGTSGKMADYEPNQIDEGAKKEEGGKSGKAAYEKSLYTDKASLEMWKIPAQKVTPSDATREKTEMGIDTLDEEPDEYADYDIFENGISFDGIRIATTSDATVSDAIPMPVRGLTGYTISDSWKNPLASSSDFRRKTFEAPENKAGGRLRNVEPLKASKANTIVPPNSDIIDWTFITYDHRTEGEIHFNKQDFDLYEKDAAFDAYAAENGDGTLEGAVYGLFAAQDIIHPDTDGGMSEYDTGIVFKKDNLVSVATTDRNGDASFMSITEAPGYTYDYDEGKIVKTDDGWAESAPQNLHSEQDVAAGKEQDVERFEGHNPDNSEITGGNGNDLTDTADGDGSFTWDYYEKYSSNQGYEDTYRTDDTTGYYPIGNNEKNNGNCWIGRPLILGKDGSSYYIKELSRSEGYELSVYGKDGALITNREAFTAGGGKFTTGAASSTKIQMDRINGGNTFTVTSSETENGYILKASNVPENATFHITTTEQVWDDEVSHPEKVQKEIPVYAKEGDLVMIGGHSWKVRLGDIIDFNGMSFTVNNIFTETYDEQKVQPRNAMVIENPHLAPELIIPSSDVMSDINRLFVKSGYRSVESGAPWVSVPVNAYDLTTIAAAINDTLFADDRYGVFNAMQMLGSYIEDGVLYITIGYSYRDGTMNHGALYNAANDTIYVKTDVIYKSASGDDMDGFLYRTYPVSSCTDVKENDNGFVTSAIVPNEVVKESPKYLYGNLDSQVTFEVRPDVTYWTYADGEQMLRTDGKPATTVETTIVDVTPTLVSKVINQELTQGSYEAAGNGTGTYTLTIPQETVEQAENGTIKFRILYEKPSIEVGGVSKDVSQYVLDNGVIGVLLPFGSAGSYIESIMLMYPGQDTVLSDAGTSANPTAVFERPIRQKIKINKDIRTLLEAKQVWYCLNCGYENETGMAACAHCNTARTTEETKTVQYLNDTYSAVHKDNISSDRNAGAYKTAKDWLAKLMGGEVDGEEARTIPNFRFKAYLKSNLERLCRDQDGNIIWLDRNGNTMTPQYQDTNGDGNFDTFTWKYDTAYKGKEVDFPEKDKMTDAGILESSNVQKIYTKVEHNVDSKTTSARANNVWDDYDTPQAGAMDNVGEKEGFTTSQRESADGSGGDLSGKAVDGNAVLYSYRGKNTNAAKTDRINGEQNAGYTRLLETRQDLMEDEAGTKRQAELYNYEKFFDAIAAANADIWDNDMHSTYTGASMANYPGQHWFETHYEKYQKDDADPDHTLENTDGADKDNTAGGDRDTSFKPFRWIREHVFGSRSDYEKHPAQHNGTNTEVVTSTSDFAKANAEASDAVRQFAVKWYLEDEAAKLMTDNGVGEDIAKDSNGTIAYDEAVYDEALFHAIAKAYNYLKPFYVNDLDTIYSVEWDSAEHGGADKDFTTLSVDVKDAEEHYNVSSYLPYGVYVIVEQQPERRDGAVNDFENRSYTIEKPKEVIVPSVYDAPEANDAADNYDGHYAYQYGMTAQDQAKAENYLIRFAEEWAQNNPQDEREYVIRAHGYDGDYEIDKYGLDIDRLTGAIGYDGGTYDYAGWKLAQETFDPLKDYYDTKHRGKAGLDAIGTENGGNDDADYMAIHQTDGLNTANGSVYDGEPLQNRFFYGSISEDAGIADPVMSMGGVAEGEYARGVSQKDGIRSMTGELTAYEGKYASMLVPWTVTAPADSKQYSAADFTGYADVNERDGFYATMLRINKVDSETGEYILHDNAIFALYAGSRYNTFEEIEADAALIADAGERAAFLAQFKPGDAKFYLKDTTIQGTREFLTAMGATDIAPVVRGKAVVESAAGPGELCSGLVKKGTPICVESERIMLTDEEGARTGQMTVYTTVNDVLVAGEKDAADKAHANQNTGYFITPQPIGAGVYVLAEIKAPDGYARSKPVPFEVYSDKTQYYVDGDMYNKVSAVRYEDKLAD